MTNFSSKPSTRAVVLKELPLCHFVSNAMLGHRHIVRVKFAAEEAAIQACRDEGGGASAHEGIKDDAGLGRGGPDGVAVFILPLAWTSGVPAKCFRSPK